MDFESYLKQPLPFEDGLGDFIGDPDGDMVIFEIGACEGEDTIKMRRKFPNAKIYAFEPLPKNVERMRANYKKYQAADINVHQLALSDKNGTAEFHVSSGHPQNLPKTKKWDYGNKSSSLLPPKMSLKTHEWLKFKDKITVKTERLDTFCKKNNVKKIDFAFIDVQGAELMVLEGAGDFLNNIGAIWLEVENIELYANQPLKNDVELFMANHGFNKVKDTVGEVSGDQLYIHNDVHQLKNSLNRHASTNFLFKVGRRARLSLMNLKTQAEEVAPEPEAEHKKISYSQSGEDLIVKFLFDNLQIKKPVYVDIGAHHPRYINNTALFYDSGSTGINIEPDPSLFEAFIADRPLDTNLNIGISPKAGKMDFYIMSAPTLNTFSKEEVANFEKEGFSLVDSIKVKTANINKVIEEHLAAAPDFINLDVEGIDFEILKGFDFNKYAPLIWCVETISFSQSGRGVKDKKLIKFLEGKGYMLYADTNINSIFIKKDVWQR